MLPILEYPCMLILFMFSQDFTSIQLRFICRLINHKIYKNLKYYIRKFSRVHETHIWTINESGVTLNFTMFKGGNNTNAWSCVGENHHLIHYSI